MTCWQRSPRISVLACVLHNQFFVGFGLGYRVCVESSWVGAKVMIHFFFGMDWCGMFRPCFCSIYRVRRIFEDWLELLGVCDNFRREWVRHSEDIYEANVSSLVSVFR